MKHLKQTVAVMLAILFSVYGFADDPVLGSWYTIDDETGEVASRVELSLDEKGRVTGRIVEILKKESGDGLCDKCEGDLHNAPIEGMRFMWGFEKDEEGAWEDGNLLDPESGDVYSGELSIGDSADELEVRGYVGISLFGRSQVWKRVQETGTPE